MAVRLTRQHVSLHLLDSSSPFYWCRFRSTASHLGVLKYQGTCNHWDLIKHQLEILKKLTSLLDPISSTKNLQRSQEQWYSKEPAKISKQLKNGVTSF